MSSKRGMRLDRVVLLGRTFEEYRRYFSLEPESLRGKSVLDVGGGVSSFCAEGNALGIAVSSIDPIFSASADEIAARAAPDLDLVYQIVHGLPTYRWDFYRNREHMRELRERALSTFLKDFAAHRGSRYLAGGLPDLPLPTRSYDITLVSYFLFVYEEQLSWEFHREAILELMRVTRGEVRIYPTVTFEGERSSYLERIKSDAALSRFHFQEVQTEFEFLINSNSFLRITHS